MNTLTYPVSVDTEMESAGISYYVYIEMDVDFDINAEAKEIQIIECQIGVLDGMDIPFRIEGRQIDKVIIDGNPDLTSAIDNAIWHEIQVYAESHAGDIQRDIETDAYERQSMWNDE